MQMLKPIKRSKVRIYAGKKYYRFRRYANWYFGKTKFANERQRDLLPYPVSFHKTPLYRQLKDVDMWLQRNKVHNLKLAVKKIDGIIIKPGETFSYWRLIGNPTKRKGYVDGMILFYGKVTIGTGGGLCQLSNLIYWITLHTPLTITERYRHSYDVFPDAKRSQPFGSGATCAYNYLDLQIRNDTEQTFQLSINLSDQYLEGEWRTDGPMLHTYEVYEKNHSIEHAYWGGYIRHNTIYRRVFNRQGVLIDDEFLTENHAIMMYEPLLEQTTSKE